MIEFGERLNETNFQRYFSLIIRFWKISGESASGPDYVLENWLEHVCLQLRKNYTDCNMIMLMKPDCFLVLNLYMYTHV